MLKRAVAALLLLSSTLAAAGGQPSNCSDMTISQRTIGRAQILTIEIDNTLSDAMTFLFHGPNAGSTGVSLPGNIAMALGIDQPFSVLPLGTTDANGELRRRLRVRANQGVFLHAQAVSIKRYGNGNQERRVPSAQACDTNVVRVRL